MNRLFELKSEYNFKYSEASKIVNEHEKNLVIFNLRKQYFSKYDELLESIKTGPYFLKDERIAEIVVNQLLRYDGELYKLIAFTIMSNHVHILIDTKLQLDSYLDDSFLENYISLDKIMKSVKGPSATYSNRVLEKTGSFWEKESFDMYIRNDKMFNNVIAYIINNPVKAGIVSHWESYKWNYVNSDFK